MSDDRQKNLQRIRTEQRMVASNMEVLQQQLEMIQLSLLNYRTGFSVLEELEKATVEEDVLLGVGGSIYIKARLPKENRVTRDIGSGVRVESTIDEAEKDIKERIEALEKRYDSLREEYRKHADYAMTLSATLQQLTAKARAPEAEE
jgi:prefoldin alpha subunit